MQAKVVASKPISRPGKSTLQRLERTTDGVDRYQREHNDRVIFETRLATRLRQVRSHPLIFLVRDAAQASYSSPLNHVAGIG